MQPYFYPYIGYFHLMNSANIFVLFDDVQYRRRGWINRNRILVDGSAKWLTVPVVKRPQSTAIDQMDYALDANVVYGLKNKIEAAYVKAPYYNEVAPILFDQIDQQTTNVARYNESILRGLANLFRLRCEIIQSSTLLVSPELRGQDRVLAVCRELGAQMYVNAIGGVELYDSESFASEGMQLRFVQSDAVQYEQFESTFVPDLSIIDIMMFNGVEGTRSFLNKYELVEAESAMVLA